MSPAKIRYFLIGILLVFSILLISSCDRKSVIPIEMAPLTAMSKAKDYISEENYEDAREYLIHITSFYPGNDLADDAQYLIGDTYYREEKYENAIVEYEMLINRYPTSEFVDNAYLHLGLSYLALSPSYYLDQDITKKAITYFDEVIVGYSKSECVEEAREGKLRALNKLAKKVFKAGNFYFDRGKYKSAEIYFDEVIKNYNNTEWYDDSMYYYGLTLMEEGKDDQAREVFIQFEDKFPDSEYSDDVKQKLQSQS